MKINLTNPPAKYRPIPFWSWNEKLETKELRRQIRAMHDAGLGGFFMHARGGLQTDYLSAEWLECISACLDEAEKMGMEAWLYDENGWPSGFGGGMVNALGVDYQLKYLRHEIAEADECGQDNTIAFYTVDGKFIGRTLPEGYCGRVLRCYYEVNPYYVDNLDPKVVAEFIRITHQLYYENLPPVLLKNLKGIFTDEPQLSRQGLAWSFVLEDEYRQAYNRELLEELPGLFINSGTSDGVRIRFWKLVARQFNQSFMKQISDWCTSHGWLLTGHQLLEETCQNQIDSNGSVMLQYQHYHVPGMDHLGRTAPSAVAMTQLYSAAMQFEHPQILTESFAMTGWNFNFSGMCWMFQQQLAHGVNLLCQHLESYSLRGLRKRDYPGSFFVHQPWWGDYKRVNDYFSRVGMLLAEGEPETEVLVVHPLSSAWCLYTGDNRNPEIAFYSDELAKLTAALDSRQIAHHYADEEITAGYGALTEGKIKIGACSYSKVIIPPVTNLSLEMAELLRNFSALGGVIAVVRNSQTPDKLTIDGEEASPEIRHWFRSLPACDSADSAAELIAAALPDLTVITENGVPARQILSSCRRIDQMPDGRSGKFYFVVNRQYNQPAQITISLPKTGEQVEIIDKETGKLSLLSGVKQSGKRLIFDYPLAAGEAAMFFVSDTPVSASAVTKAVNISSLPLRKALTEEFQIAAHSGNLLTLDRCRYRVDGGEWIPDEVNVIQARLLNRKRDCELELEFSFELAPGFDVNTPLTLVTETPERFSFALNGTAFEAADTGELFDRAFRKIPLPSNLRTGVNVITMKTLFHQVPEVFEALERAKKFETEYHKLTFDSEIESVYLYGDFAVTHHGRIEPLSRGAERFHGTWQLDKAEKTVNGADIVQSGFPFFAGKITLRQEFDLTAEEADTVEYFRFTPAGANSYRIKLNGREAGFLYSGQYAVRIAGMVQAGRNILEIELTTSLRNMLGPHHLAIGESYSVNTMSFNREPNAAGRMPPPYDFGYCMVKQGITAPELV